MNIHKNAPCNFDLNGEAKIAGTILFVREG
jgi:hypothetical protein